MKIELRYICCPLLQRLFGTEIPIDDIVRNFTNVAFVRMVLLFWTFAKQCKPVHNSLNTLVIYLKPTVQKFMVYPSHAVSFSVLVENSGNFRR